MNKPEKRKPDKLYTDKGWQKAIGYNQAIDDYEAYLPSKKEIKDIIEHTECSVNNFIDDLTDTICKRIGAE